MHDEQDEFKMAPGFAVWMPGEQKYHVGIGKKMMNSILDTLSLNIKEGYPSGNVQ